MKLRLSNRGLVLLAGVTGAAAAAIAASGCGGGDDTSISSPSSDASVEATTDSAVESQDADASGLDTGTLLPEAGIAEAGTGGPDASDAGSERDAGDASVSQYDGSLAQFPAAVSGAFCTAKQVCCLVSAAQWNQADCVREVELGGGFRSLSTYTHSFDGGHVVLDASAAATCLSDMQTLLTSACGVLTSTTVLRLQGECYGAVNGTLGVDAGPCTSSIECANNEYCSDAGVCTHLEGLGEPCLSSDSCSYRGTPGSGIYCNLAADGGAGQCAPTEGLDGGDCATAVYAYVVCRSGLCGFNPGCADSITFTDPGPHSFLCTFIIPDAGPSDAGDGGD